MQSAKCKAQRVGTALRLYYPPFVREVAKSKILTEGVLQLHILLPSLLRRQPPQRWGVIHKQISSTNSNLFTLNTFYTANKRIVKIIGDDSEAETFVYDFWKNVVVNMREWNEMDKGELSKKSLREDYITTQGLIILALGRLGEYFCQHPEIDVDLALAGLKKIDWLRNNEECWMNRAIKPNGKINRNEQGIFLTYVQIKRLLSLPISDEEQKKELIMKG